MTPQSTNKNEPRLKELALQIEALTEDYLAKAAHLAFLKHKTAQKEQEVDTLGNLLVNRFNEQVRLERENLAGSPRRPTAFAGETVASSSI